MKLIKPYTEIVSNVDGTEALKQIEAVARTCYKSEHLIDESGESAKKLVKRLIDSKHEAMLEFYDITVKFVTDRGVSHELVRHRMASYAQESTRYCNYSNEKFGNELTFIIPSWCNIPETSIESFGLVDWRCLPNYEEAYDSFYKAIMACELNYKTLIEKGWKPEQARQVLPNALKTEINMKCNLREWRHFFKLRCHSTAHPDVRVLAIDLLKKFHDQIPVVFDDLYEEYGEI